MRYPLVIISVTALWLAGLNSFQQLGLGSLPLAIVLGIAVGNLLPARIRQRDLPWLGFAKQKLLRLGIILFGCHLTFQQVVGVGWHAMVFDIVIIVSVLTVGYLVGTKLLKLSPEVTWLTSVGSAVCGAAAILATEPVLKSRQRDVSVAVATVVVFGTTALMLYPVIFHWLAMPSDQFGIYIGGTVHEVAQAVAAGQTIDSEAMETALIVKLMRVLMLAPVVMAIAYFYRKQQTANHEQTDTKFSLPIPWFVFGFLAVVLANSFVQAPPLVLDGGQWLAQTLLTIAMAALGLQTRFDAIREAGVKPLILSGVLFVLLLGGGLIVHLHLIH